MITYILEINLINIRIQTEIIDTCIFLLCILNKTVRHHEYFVRYVYEIVSSVFNTINIT